MAKQHIRSFSKFQSLKRAFESKATNEAVVQIDDVYKVGGIEVLQSTINSYVKKVKTETGKNLRQMFSDMEIADNLVRYVASNRLDVDKIPSSALLGGDKQIIDEEDNSDMTSSEVTTDTTEQPIEDSELEQAEDSLAEDDIEDEAEENKLPEESESDDFESTLEEPAPATSEAEPSEGNSEEDSEESEEDNEDSEDETQDTTDDNEELPI